MVILKVWTIIRDGVKTGFSSVKIAIRNEIEGEGLYLYIVKIENFHLVLTSSLTHTCTSILCTSTVLVLDG